MPKVTITSILRAVATAVTVSIAISCNVNNLPHQLGEAESFMRHSPKQAKEILAQAGKYRTTLEQGHFIGCQGFRRLVQISCLFWSDPGEYPDSLSCTSRFHHFRVCCHSGNIPRLGDQGQAASQEQAILSIYLPDSYPVFRGYVEGVARLDIEGLIPVVALCEGTIYTESVD